MFQSPPKTQRVQSHPVRSQTPAGSLLRVILVSTVFAFSNGYAWAQSSGIDLENHGHDGTGHDEVRMPGLQGKYATTQESAELAEMFRNFQNITREVTYLPNGIRTITFSEDEELMSVVVSHVIGMINRVDEGRDPKIIIQSPTLDILFERRDRIVTAIETTDQGIIVIQTSDDPEVVAALQIHAEEVTDLVDRGMQAVHEALMKRGGT